MKRRIRLGLLALVLTVALTFTAVGCAGTTGLRGTSGSAGSQGIQGVQGEQGLVGPVGPQGESGQVGAIGATGVTGATGSDGAVGAVGPRGLQGAAGWGSPGATGADGINGVDGADLGLNILTLHPKDSNDPLWPIIDGQKGGVLVFNSSGPEFQYVLSAHGLLTATEYSLIYYADPWPGTGGFLIAEGTTNASGSLFLIGEVDLASSIPVAADTNYPDGGKIWLVPSSDYGAGEITNWNPLDYLHEHNLISYTDTDLIP